jgi:non-homologous end joining protein Ku
MRDLLAFGAGNGEVEKRNGMGVHLGLYADFEAVKIKSTQTVDIKEFVNLDRIDPMFYDQPYFLAPEKGGAKAYGERVLRRL